MSTRGLCTALGLMLGLATTDIASAHRDALLAERHAPLGDRPVHMNTLTKDVEPVPPKARVY